MQSDEDVDTLSVSIQDLWRGSLGIGELLCVGELSLYSLREVSHAFELESAVDEFLVLNIGFEALSIVADSEILGKEAVHTHNLAIECTLRLL